MNTAICDRIKNSNCQKCPDLVAMRKQIVVAKGNPEANVVIIGQNPGAVEDNVGQPFMGPAGNYLHYIIEVAGYRPMSEFFFTNAVLCLTHNSSQLLPSHLSNCSSNLKTLTDSFEIGIAVGRQAAIGFAMAHAPELVTRMNIAKMEDLVTHGVPVTTLTGKSLFITYHPSYLLRQGLNKNDVSHKLFQQLLSQIRAAKNWKQSSQNISSYASTSLF